MREIDWRLKYSAKRNKQLYKVEAVLHEMNLKLTEDVNTENDIQELKKEDLDKIENARIKALDRKRKLHHGGRPN